MRKQIIDAIYNWMELDERIFFLIGDMGINLVEKIEEKFPKRFVNVGIAEQNLIGVSAGLANAGFLPIAYTISNFLIHRCFEQIRNDIVLHQYPVTLIGTSAGFDNSPLAPTHHIIDEWGALRSFPGIDIYCPSSAKYAEGILPKVFKRNRPAYIRVPKGEFQSPASEQDVVHMKGTANKVLFVSYGTAAQDCLRAREQNPDFGCLILNQLVPLDRTGVITALNEYQKIVVVEDHFRDTGLYGMICELCASSRIAKDICSRSPENYDFEVGKSNAYFHKKYRFDSESLVADFR